MSVPVELLVSQLKDATSASNRISILKRIKNLVIGHQNKNSFATQDFVLPLLEQCSRTDTDRNHNAGIGGIGSPSTDHELIRLEAIHIIGSLAHDGRRVSETLLRNSALAALLTNTCPQSNSATLVLATLRVLFVLANTALLSTLYDPTLIESYSELIFAEPYVTSLRLILSQKGSSIVVENQVALVASLVTKLCRTEHHRKRLFDEGILDALAKALARVIIDQGVAHPGRDCRARIESEQRSSTLDCTGASDITSILQALVAVIGNSNERARSLAYSGIILETLSRPTVDSGRPARGLKTDHGSPLSLHSQLTFTSIDNLVPKTPDSVAAIQQTSRFMGAPSSIQASVLDPVLLSDQNMAVDLTTYDGSLLIDEKEKESPLIPYLIWLARVTKGAERLMAAQLLTSLYRSGMAAEHRQIDIGLLVIPVLSQQLHHLGSLEEEDAKTMLLIEEIPSVLASLAGDSEYLQKAAFDAGAVTSLSSLLKYSFDPITINTASWTPLSHKSIQGSISDETEDLIEEKIARPLYHRLKVRENVLKAIASCSPLKDEYRKTLVGQGIMPFIVESLNLRLQKPIIEIASQGSSPRIQKSMEMGELTKSNIPNSMPVLVAACSIVRHLSRSPSLLRTTLVDHGVVRPIFELLTHSNLELQTAATAAVINLVTEMSPMREDLLKAGVLKVLCQLAHSRNSKLRYHALWALKHLIQASGIETKKECLGELGQEWLIDVISKADDDDNLRKPDIDGDSNMETAGDYVYGDPGATLEIASSHQTPSMDEDSAARTKKDKLSILEQSLDFLRNLIGGFDSSGTNNTADMIDSLFHECGEDVIFDILTAKIRPRASMGSEFSACTSLGEQLMFPEPEIIVNVQYILVNIAASVPRHREAIVRRTELLELLLRHFEHPAREVRLSLCWLVVNLTWVENDHDETEQFNRVKELAKLGYLSKLDCLLKDADLDVRERAKTALFQMRAQST